MEPKLSQKAFSVNKHERSEVKKIILAEIDLLVEKLPIFGSASGEMLRLERLKSALMCIDADNFGDCLFKQNISGRTPVVWGKR